MIYIIFLINKIDRCKRVFERFKFYMLQRNHRTTLEQVVSQTRQRLHNQFEALRNSDLRTAQLFTTAELILDMYSNVHHPITCLKVIKQNFNNMKHPHHLQLQMIMDKAEIFYLQSVTHDLNQLKEQERILTIPSDDIKDYIQQINWKHGYDRDSILNESQEIGDNIDLMKFFQGVRNYQNWEENLERQIIEKLKFFANQAENKLTFRKGYQVSKITNLLSKYQQENISTFFNKAKRQIQTNKKLSIFNKILTNTKMRGWKQIESLMGTKSEMIKLQEFFQDMFWKNKKKQILTFSSKLKKYDWKISKLSELMKKIMSRVYVQSGNVFMQKLFGRKSKRMINLGFAAERLDRVVRKLLLRKMKQHLNLPLVALTKIIDKNVKIVNEESFTSIKIASIEKQPIKISQKMKGKIILSLQKHEKKPIDLRKTFLNWYLKGTQQKHSKMIYNIWLNGNTSKFSFFMRIKNAINQSKKMKIKPQLKMFLLIFMQKINGYYNYNQKHFLSKWHQNHRHCKNTSHFLKVLLHDEKLINQKCQRYAIQMIKQTAFLKKITAKYLSKRIAVYGENMKKSFQIMKNLPNVRKIKGKSKLLQFLRIKLQANQSELRETFSHYRANLANGKSKKLKFVTKYLGKDILYYSTFTNIWRRNVNAQKVYELTLKKQQMNLKQKGIQGILSQLERKQHNEIKDGLKKFYLMLKFSEQRKKHTTNYFQKLLRNFQNKNKIQSLACFKKDLNVGKQKKEKLTINLVNANKMKQISAFSILKTFAFDKNEEDKKIRVNQMFQKLTSSVKYTTDYALRTNYIYETLQKIILNRSQNVRNSFSSIKNLPQLIDWKKKSNAIKLFERLNHLNRRQKLGIYNIFKNNYFEGQYSKKKILDVMTFKYIDCGKNYFKIYLNNVREQIMKEKHQNISKVFDNLQQVSKGTYKIIFEGEQTWNKKMNCLKKLDNLVRSRVKDTMLLWHNEAKSLTYFKNVMSEKKIRLIGFVSDILKKNSLTETKNVVRLFDKNAKIIKIQTKFLNKLCDSQAGKVIKAMMIWKNLPKPKNKQLIAKASKFQSSLFHFSSKIMRFSFTVFKDMQYLGNDRKKLAIRKLVAKSCNGIGKYFKIWKQNNFFITMFSKLHKITQMTEQIDKLQTQQFKILFQGNISEKVEKAFLKIGKRLKNKQSLIFVRWMKNSKELNKNDKQKKACLKELAYLNQSVTKQYIKQTIQKIKMEAFRRKMNEEMNNANKKAILQKINGLIHGKSQVKVKNIVKLFYRNFKVTKVQKKFIERLLQTKSGKVVEAFCVWKDLPNQNMMEKYKKGQKFFFKLENMVKGKLKQAHNSFNDANDEGGTIKKTAVIQLLDRTSNGMRRYYNRWDFLTKRGKTLSQVTEMVSSFETLHQNLANTFKIVFADQRSIKIKTWAINRLVEASNQGIIRYFKKWRTNIQEQKAKQEILKFKKTQALSLFTNVLGKSERAQTKNIISLFQKNVSITKISRNFLNRLLKTKSGKVIQVFEIWRNLPSAKMAAKKKKAIKFESKIHKLVNSFLKKTYDPFKSSSYEGNNKKKLCIEKLIRASMGQQKRKFLLWRQIIKQEKMLKHTNLFQSLFDTMKNVLSSNIELLIKDTGKEVTKKKQLCRKLINNSNFVQHHSYLIWKQALQSDNVNKEREEGKVKVSLVNFINIQNKSTMLNFIDVIMKFKKESESKKLQEINLKKEEKNRKAIQFYNKLKVFSQNRLSIFINTVSKQHFEATIVNKNKSIQNSFETLNSLLSQNFKIVMRSNKQTLIVEKAINRFSLNVGSSISKFFHIWRENKNILKMESAMNDEKKKNILKILNKFMNDQDQQKIPLAIKKFEKNYKVTKLMREILTKICQTKAGKVPLAFMIWKGLPNPDSKKIKQKAIKFESGLFKLFFKKIKATYDNFKNEHYQGENKKKMVINKLIFFTLSDTNRTFNKWRKINSQYKITSKMTSLSKFFDITTEISKKNNILLHPSDDNLKKINAVKQIVKNKSTQLQQILNIWKINIQDHKCYSVNKILSKYEPKSVNDLHLKSSFQKIKKKSEMEILRTYINSLWKWKMSNMQANYYAKFIKVFKESQELLILSDIFNKKKYEHLHNGFRAITNSANSRQQRKCQIVEKYLTRKFSNYFQRFKLNTCFQQIKIWRNTYKGTIKSKVMTQKITTYARKTLKQAFENIQYAGNLRSNVTILKDKLVALQQNLKKKSFHNIYSASYARFIDRIDADLNFIRINKIQQAFNLIKKTSQIHFLQQKIQKISAKYLLKHAYDMINYKRNMAIKYTFAIKLLNNIQSQNVNKKVRQAIKQFKKYSQKGYSLRNIGNMLLRKQRDNLEELFKKGKEAKEKAVLLSQFLKGMKIRKIIEKQDKKLMKQTLQKMKKKENKWIVESIKRFVVRSNIKSSMAVSLWRLKNFQAGNFE